MKVILKLLLLCGLLVIFHPTVHAKGQLFGLLPKSPDNRASALVLQGCNDAAQINNDRCELLGNTTSSASHTQAAVLTKAAQTNRYQAFGLSINLENNIADTVGQEISVPVVTYNSPFLPKDSFLSGAFVGPDNVVFGEDLAEVAKKLLPNGGTIFIMADTQSTEIVQRLIGLRRELAQTESYEGIEKLNGQNNWFEHQSSPWKEGKSTENKVKLDFILRYIRPDIFISVYDWPAKDVAVLKEIIVDCRKTVPKGATSIVVGAEEITTELEDLVNNEVISGLVSINFSQIGHLSYSIMHTLVKGEEVARWNFVPNTILQSAGSNQ